MKILLGMSGGVDSSFAARLLMDSGYEVEGCVLVMHEYTELSEAQRAAKELGIALRVIDVKKPFDEIVKKNFISEYQGGRTPNPCIICNERIKFRYMLDYASENGFDRIATGHYAGVIELSENGKVRHAVKMAEDRKKDQSYMLYRLPEDILSRLILPLSTITKDEIRQRADRLGLSSAGKKDSQEICFLPDGNYPEYIEGALGKFPEGDFLSEDGIPLGKHKGYIRYTVGQRKGLGISMGERVFVTEIDPLQNTVTLAADYKGREEVELSDVVFSGMERPEKEKEICAFAKVRYSAPLTDVCALIRADGSVKLRFNSPAKVCPGQSCVLYNKEGTVLFGGFIKSF